MLKWKKQGKIFDPTAEITPTWMNEYAQLPSSLVIGSDCLRVYFASRPSRDTQLQYVSRSGYVDLDINDFSTIVSMSEQPILQLGDTGSFDEFGSMTSCFVPHNSNIYAYYTGWTRMQSVPYTMSIGMAISKDNGNTFTKVGKGPILAPTPKEPYVISGPVVKYIDGLWHMWYLMGTKWIEHNGKKEPIYKLAHALSEDGIIWKRDGVQVIESILEDECQVSFGIFYYNDRWNTIFAYRQPTDFRANSTRSYRIGYASSTDLKTWHRDDKMAGITVSDSGWDSEMICYPHVFELNRKIYMFYCGNNFGEGGFGYAELEM